MQKPDLLLKAVSPLARGVGQARWAAACLQVSRGMDDGMVLMRLHANGSVRPQHPAWAAPRLSRRRLSRSLPRHGHSAKASRGTAARTALAGVTGHPGGTRRERGRAIRDVKLSRFPERELFVFPCAALTFSHASCACLGTSRWRWIWCRVTAQRREGRKLHLYVYSTAVCVTPVSNVWKLNSDFKWKAHAAVK